jgi:hypothetical protein
MNTLLNLIQKQQKKLINFQKSFIHNKRYKGHRKPSEIKIRQQPDSSAFYLSLNRIKNMKSKKKK